MIRDRVICLDRLKLMCVNTERLCLENVLESLKEELIKH